MRTVARVATAGYLAAAILAVACSGADEPTAPVAPPSPTITIRISPATGSVEVGDTIRFAAAVTDASGQAVANPAISWSTSATLAWVGANGLVTGGGPGQVTVTASSQGAEGSATLTVTASPVSALLLDVRRQHGLIALAGAIVTSHGLVDVGAVGTRALGSPVPVTIHDKWHLGSITKSMTSTLAGVFVEQGSLSWATTLDQVFPDLAATIHTQLRPVPIEPILAHRGGFTNAIGEFAAWNAMFTSTDPLPAQRRAFVAEVLATPPEFKPLGTYHYSNVGYMVAGTMLEAVTGEVWEDLMRTHVFEPLGMDDTGFGAPGVAGAMDQPRGHSGQGGTLTVLEPNAPGADNPAGIGPAGTVHATMQDLARYVAMHLAGEQGRGDLLQPETIRRLHTPAAGFSYASGWAVTSRDWAGGRTLTHAGSNLRWYAVVWMAPERDFAVLAATNQAGDPARSGTDDAAGRLIQHYLGRP